MPAATPRPPRAATRSTLLSGPSNKKLGALVHSWSLPEVVTCPGATDFCKSVCYVRGGHFSSPHIRARYKSNLAESRKADFAARMAREIRRGLVRTVRIHVAGDFYSAAYARKWAAIAAACPDIKFFAYSRSWRTPAILPALLGLAALPNFQLWYSEDRDSGRSPANTRVRVCFLVQTKEDEALVDPARHDLVFRDGAHRKVGLHPGQLKTINNVRICPHEQRPRRIAKALRASTLPAITCSSCRICLKEPRARREASPVADPLRIITLD